MDEIREGNAANSTHITKSSVLQAAQAIGVDAESLRLLNPTKEQLGQLLGRFQKLHDRRLVRFISSLITDTAQDLLLDERPCKEQQVPLALPYPAHRVGKPLAAVGNVFGHWEPFGGKVSFQLVADSHQHLKFKLAVAT